MPSLRDSNRMERQYAEDPTPSVKRRYTHAVLRDSNWMERHYAEGFHPSREAAICD
jgi:hypothetical protein